MRNTKVRFLSPFETQVLFTFLTCKFCWVSGCFDTALFFVFPPPNFVYQFVPFSVPLVTICQSTYQNRSRMTKSIAAICKTSMSKKLNCSDNLWVLPPKLSGIFIGTPVKSSADKTGSREKNRHYIITNRTIM